MTLLGIETSCDETSAAVIEADKNKLVLKSNIVASSLSLHAQTGGVIPEIAARQQLHYMIPVIEQALQQADVLYTDIDAIAVTFGPGLIGSLLVGVETAKTLGFILNIPLVPVNHMIGHIYANFIDENPKSEARNSKLDAKRYGLNASIEFPALALVVSGGHTDLLLLKEHGNRELLGGTRDDAAGEAFDKIGRLIGLSYPGGPAIEKAAKKGDAKRFQFPRPLHDSDDYDFSFSGLKTAVLREVTKLHSGSSPSPFQGEGWGEGEKVANKFGIQTIADLSASVQQAIIDVLIKKTVKAAQEYQVRSILLSGGVAANETLRQAFLQSMKEKTPNTQFFVPPKDLCTDNAAMIAAAGYYEYNPVSWKEVIADPELYFE